MISLQMVVQLMLPLLWLICPKTTMKHGERDGRDGLSPASPAVSAPSLPPLSPPPPPFSHPVCALDVVNIHKHTHPFSPGKQKRHAAAAAAEESEELLPAPASQRRACPRCTWRVLLPIVAFSSLFLLTMYFGVGSEILF